MSTASPKNMPVVIAKPDRLENPNHFVADDFDDENIQAAVVELGPMLDDFRQGWFQWYYDLGEVVREHYEKVWKEREERGHSMYGQRFFRRLAQDLKRPNVDGQLLNKCFKLVETYSEEEYQKLCQNDAISPTHALILGLIGDDEESRIKLEEKVISEKLTTKQLFEAEKEMFGVRRKSGGGRPLKVPSDVKKALVHATSQTEKFLKSNDTIWFGDEFDIIAEIADLPADKLTAEFKDQVIEAAGQYESLAAAATKDAKALRDTLPNVERRMKAQAELEAWQQAEMEKEEKESALGAAG